ncbi:hypothetical protein CL617_00495 [archaeon]|nr:hypothetical protein [archaeon]|tara:strand:+ start:2201 stop:3274 length:1074 start_codon:yes stop_codon:yes gene_type:complete
MEKYIFVLGRDGKLSLLELISFLEAREIKFKVEYHDNYNVVMSLDSFNFSIEELGGIIKIAKVISENEDNQEIEFELNNVDFDYGNKFKYSINGSEFLRDYFKERFKGEKVKALFKKDATRPSDSQKLDFEIIKVKNFTGKIIEVSNPEKYKKRDEKRPKFEGKKVISIRLAKILINISKARENILDPFCGIGTVLQESLLKNLDVYGLDIEVKDAEENLAWLKKEFKIEKKYELKKGDAKELSKYFTNVESVVTEPFMGPFVKERYSREDALKLKEELTSLYRDFFSELSKIVSGRVVFISPVFKVGKELIKIDMFEILRDTKFKAYNNKQIEIPVVYEVNRTRLIREIWVLESFK